MEGSGVVYFDALYSHLLSELEIKTEAEITSRCP
jgi:hypothetical protein